MNKQTIMLPGQQVEWGSYISKYQPDSQKVLDNMFTAGSKNFVTDQTGMIDKRQGGVIWNRTSFSGPAADSYEAVFESGARHFLRVGQGILSASTGNGLFDTITAGYSTFGFFEWATYQDRVYGDNGVNPSQVYDTVTNYGGVSYSFTTGKTKVMGAQSPLTAPTAGTPTAGGAVPVGAHRYKITFMYYDSEESNGSPASAAQTATAGNQTIPLTSIPVGGYGVTARNVYRDDNDGNFLLLDTIPNNTATTYTDTLLQGATPTPIPEFNDVPPTFSHVALWLDALWITPTGETNTLRYSNTGSPDIFDPDNFVVCQSDDVITAITVYNGKLYVHGLHSFGSIEGTTPDTFYYNNISRTVGCTDNRSIQVRSIVSVPTLWWLSDKGLYYSNGYTVEYGSDFIQDLVNLNLAQVNYSTNKNTQNSQPQYAGDTYTPGIDITSIPGTITTIDPKADYSQTSDWLGGSVVTNLKTSDANLAEVPTQFAPTLPSGVYGGSAVPDGTGNNITIQAPAPFTGESQAAIGTSVGVANTLSSPNGVNELAQKIVVTVGGNVTNITIPMYVLSFNNPSPPVVWHIQLYQDSGGLPGSVLFSASQSVPNSFSPQLVTFSTGAVSWPIAAGTYWIGVLSSQPVVNALFDKVIYASLTGSGWSGNTTAFARANAVPSIGTTSWSALSDNQTNNTYTISGSYSFLETSGAALTGTWSSTVYDSGAVSSVPGALTVTASYPASTSSSITVYTSASSGMGSPNTQVFSSLNGTSSLTLTGLRYWQVVITVSTTNDVNVPLVSAPVVTFSTSAIWVSQPVDATTDNTGWASLSFAGNTPAGTSVALAIATSSDNITYSSFGPVGSAVTTRWAKVQMILMTDPSNIVSPSVSDVTLTWALSSTIESSAIDTGVTPAGFSTMQFEESNLSAGTVTMYIRTATTALGLPSATYVLVPNGTFPNLSPLEFVQWKLVLTATADTSPEVTSITVNWFVGSNGQVVRCASLFFNKTYYLSVATIGSTFNNVLIQLDQFGKFRIQTDNSVGTLLLYFNTLYFTDGTNGNIYNGFIAPTDNGTPISMDVRTKAWSSVDNIFLKVPRGLKITGLHTGTTIHAYYSPDRGGTWIEMLNENGATGYATSTGGTEFVILFVPDAASLTSGRTLMYRIVSNDSAPCSILNFEPSFYTRKARYLNNG
jgi:hypothetical protein